jgi:RNA polymerase sigma-70 factor (ECF subfamily)
MLERAKPGDRIGTLVEKAQKGDRVAFEALVREHRDRARGLVLHLLRKGCPDIDADDVLQETFLRAFTLIRSFSFRGEDSFLRWFGGIAGNVIREMEKRRRKEPRVGLTRDRASEDPSQGKVLRRRERFERLRAALDGLSPEHREVLLLSRIKGLPLKEVARRMDRSHGAVRALLWRAVQALRERFGDTESLHLPDLTLDERGAEDE